MNILFPIETESRELDYKLLLASVLAGKNGRSIHFGSFQFLDKSLSHFKNGLYVGKNIFRNDARKFKPKGYYEQKARGIDSIYYYEEGGFFFKNDELWKERLEFSCNPRVFDSKDYVFVWGERQKQVLSEIAKHPENIKNVGVVRFDLYNQYKFLYKEKGEKYQKELKDYVLINTHYGAANNHNNFTKQLHFFKYPGMNTQERIGFLARYSDDFENLMAMVELVLQLASKFQHINFVVRPHPSENLNFYKDVFTNQKNIHVIRDGSVGEWLVGAKALIHGGCTTSFESHFMGVPVITYIRKVNEHTIYPASEIGYILDDTEKIQALVKLILEKKQPSEYGYTYSIRGNEVINNLNLPATELFLGEFESIEQNYLQNNKGVQFKSPSSLHINKLFYKKLLFEKLYIAYNTLLNRHTKLNSQKYINNKFPGFNREKIESLLKKIEENTGKKVKLKFYNSHYFVIS